MASFDNAAKNAEATDNGAAKLVSDNGLNSAQLSDMHSRGVNGDSLSNFPDADTLLSGFTNGNDKMSEVGRAPHEQVPVNEPPKGNDGDGQEAGKSGGSSMSNDRDSAREQEQNKKNAS